uniref:Putative secreted protein n=1 Tax=Rhipicephalus microplus TaxID=6941 RepID=A0A6M2DCV0_RHIMP
MRCLWNTKVLITLFAPVFPTDNMRSLNRHTVPVLLEGLEPNDIKEGWMDGLNIDCLHESNCTPGRARLHWPAVWYSQRDSLYAAFTNV